MFIRRFGVPVIDSGTVRLPRMIGKGLALEEAQALAGQIAELPQRALRADRRSVLTQWSLNVDEAARAEYRGGLDVLVSGEAGDGARRLVEGAGRHGE